MVNNCVKLNFIRCSWVGHVTLYLSGKSYYSWPRYKMFVFFSHTEPSCRCNKGNACGAGISVFDRSGLLLGRGEIDYGGAKSKFGDAYSESLAVFTTWANRQFWLEIILAEVQTIYGWSCWLMKERKLKKLYFVKGLHACIGYFFREFDETWKMTFFPVPEGRSTRFLKNGTQSGGKWVHEANCSIVNHKKRTKARRREKEDT